MKNVLTAEELAAWLNKQAGQRAVCSHVVDWQGRDHLEIPSVSIGEGKFVRAGATPGYESLNFDAGTHYVYCPAGAWKLCRDDRLVIFRDVLPGGNETTTLLWLPEVPWEDWPPSESAAERSGL